MTKLVLEFRDSNNNIVEVKDLKGITEKEFKSLRSKYKAYGKTLLLKGNIKNFQQI